MRNLLALLVVLGLGATGLFYYVAETEGDGDMCVARSRLFQEQIPPALDKLSEKYPGSIGLIRSLFNEGGKMDEFLIDVVAAYIEDEDEREEVSQLDCAWEYLRIYFNKEEIQDEIVASVEEGLGLR